MVDDISHEGLRQLLHDEDVSFQALRSWKRSNDPDFERKKNRVLELYAIADGLAKPAPDDPSVVVCLDEFGPLNLQPQPGGKAWAPRAKPRRIRVRYPAELRLGFVLDNFSAHKGDAVRDWARDKKRQPR